MKENKWLQRQKTRWLWLSSTVGLLCKTMNLLQKHLVMLTIMANISFANDGFGALGAGGIIIGKTNDIAMVKEVLDISYDTIKVDYEFVNESDHDITETIVFPLPPYKADTPLGPYAGVMPNFAILVDGQSVTFNTKVRAMQKGVDVTDMLRQIGFNDYEIAMFPFDEKLVSNHNLMVSPDKKALLIKNGLAIDVHYTVLANWENHVVYEWRQTFKAGKKVKVSHSYAPFVAIGSASGYCLEGDSLIKGSRESLITNFCADKKTLNILDSLYADEKNRDLLRQLSGAIVDYVLLTANTWKDGVRDFKLIIRTKSPKEVVALCFPKPLRKVNDTTYEVELKNFKPTSDLRVYFGNIKSQDGLRFGEAPVFKK